MNKLQIFTLGYQKTAYNPTGSLLHKVESFEDLRNLAKGKAKNNLPVVFPTFGQRGKEYFNVNIYEDGECWRDDDGNMHIANLKIDNTPRIEQLANLYRDKFDCTGLYDYEVEERAVRYYTENCPSHRFGGSNVVLIDIDSKVPTEPVMKNADKINELCNNSILFIQPSFSGKLHIIMHIRKMCTIEEYQREAAIAMTWVCKAIEKVVGIDPFTLTDSRGKCCVDPTSYSAATSIYISNNDYVLNPNCWEFEIDDEQREKVCKVAGVKFEKVFREKVDYPPVNPFGGEFTITNPHKVKVDRNYIVGNGWSGNDVRMQYANVMWWYCKGDMSKYDNLRRQLFKNWNEFTPVGDKNPIPLFKAAFDDEFGIVVTATNTEHNPTLTNGTIIEKGHWLTEFQGEIENELEANRRIEVVSPTGTCKTVLITEYARKHKTLIIVPFNSQLVNYGCSWINVISRDNKNFATERSNVAVYDQAIKFINFLEDDWTVIVDECHLLWCDRSWRESATLVVEKINKLKNKVMLLTATNTIEDTLFSVKKTLTYIRERDVVEVKWMDVTNPYTTITKLIANDKKTCIFSDQYARVIAANQGLRKGRSNVVLCHSKSNSKGYQRILDNQLLDAPLTVSTKILYSGNNFNNEEPIRLIVQINHDNDYSYIVQSVGRFRKCQDLEVYVVNNVRQRTGDAITDQRTIDGLRSMSVKGSNIAKVMSDRHKEEDYYNPNVAAEIQQYYDSITKDKIIADLCATGYIKVIDCGMCDDGKEHPLNEVKRSRSDNLIDNIRRCSNLNDAIIYDEDDDSMTKSWKNAIESISMNVKEEAVRRYIVERTDSSAIQIESIIAELYSIINIKELSLSEIDRIKENAELFAAEECKAYGMVDEDVQNKIWDYAKRIARLLNRIEIEFPTISLDNLSLEDYFKVVLDDLNEYKIGLRLVRAHNSSVGGQNSKQSITIQFVGKHWDDSGLEGIERSNGIITFASKGNCMRFLGIGSKAFSKFVKGMPTRVTRNWQVVSAGA